MSWTEENWNSNFFRALQSAGLLVGGQLSSVFLGHCVVRGRGGVQEAWHLDKKEKGNLENQTLEDYEGLEIQRSSWSCGTGDKRNSSKLFTFTTFDQADYFSCTLYLVVVPEHVVAPDDGEGQDQGEQEYQQGRGHEAEHRAGERRQPGAAPCPSKHSSVRLREEKP